MTTLTNSLLIILSVVLCCELHSQEKKMEPSANNICQNGTKSNIQVGNNNKYSANRYTTIINNYPGDPGPKSSINSRQLRELKTSFPDEKDGNFRILILPFLYYGSQANKKNLRPDEIIFLHMKELKKVDTLPVSMFWINDFEPDFHYDADSLLHIKRDNNINMVVYGDYDFIDNETIRYSFNVIGDTLTIAPNEYVRCLPFTDAAKYHPTRTGLIRSDISLIEDLRTNLSVTKPVFAFAAYLFAHSYNWNKKMIRRASSAQLNYHLYKALKFASSKDDSLAVYTYLFEFGNIDPEQTKSSLQEALKLNPKSSLFNKQLLYPCWRSSQHVDSVLTVLHQIKTRFNDDREFFTEFYTYYQELLFDHFENNIDSAYNRFTDFFAFLSNTQFRPGHVGLDCWDGLAHSKRQVITLLFINKQYRKVVEFLDSEQLFLETGRSMKFYLNGPYGSLDHIKYLLGYSYYKLGDTSRMATEFDNFVGSRHMWIPLWESPNGNIYYFEEDPYYLSAKYYFENRRDCLKAYDLIYTSLNLWTDIYHYCSRGSKYTLIDKVDPSKAKSIKERRSSDYDKITNCMSNMFER